MKAYSFSRCITNLGVDPRVLFLTFLFLPIFTFLFDLLNLVTFVFETILKLRTIKVIDFINLSKDKFLPILVKPVKIFVFFVFMCVAAEAKKSIQVTEKTTLLLSIGEHKELEYRKIHKFTVTNSSIIGHKIRPKESIIIIKGRKLGFTEVIIWTSKAKKIYQVYVLEKKRQLKILHIAETLKGMGLKIKLAGPLITASGAVHDLKNYIFLKQLEIEKNKSLILKVNIEKELRNDIFLTIYERFFTSFEDHISCQAIFLEITCDISDHIDKKFYSDLEKSYKVKFLPIVSESNEKNYFLTIKFYKVATTNSQSFDKGFSSLSGNITDLLESKWSSLIQNNHFQIGGNSYFTQTIGNHRFSLTLDHDSVLQLGSEQSFNQFNNKTSISSTSWKFSGFKIKCRLQLKGNKYFLKFETNFSRPNGQGQSNFTSSKNNSTIFLTLNNPQNIFTSSSINVGKEDQLIPYLSTFPILGSLFKSNKNVKLNERIIAYVKLESN